MHLVFEAKHFAVHPKLNAHCRWNVTGASVGKRNMQFRFQCWCSKTIVTLIVSRERSRVLRKSNMCLSKMKPSQQATSKHKNVDPRYYDLAALTTFGCRRMRKVHGIDKTSQAGSRLFAAMPKRVPMHPEPFLAKSGPTLTDLPSTARSSSE